MTDIKKIIKMNPNIDVEQLEREQSLIIETQKLGSASRDLQLTSPINRHRAKIDTESIKEARTIKLSFRG